MSTVSVPHRLGLFIQSTNGQLDKSGTGTGKGKGTGTGTGRGASPGPQCHNGKANDRRKMTVAMLKNVTTTTTPMPAYVCVCVCVSLFCSCVRCLVTELRKFFCYLNHVSLSKQHLPIQARQQLPHLLPRLLQRPEAVATVSLPSFFCCWCCCVLCGHKHRVARCFWHLVKLPSVAVKTFVLLSLRRCFYCCCYRSCCCSHFAIFVACCANIKHFTAA